MYENICTLSECRPQLLSYLEDQVKRNTDRNKDWFPRLLRDIDKYLLWSVVFQDNDIVAFSNVQSHHFDSGCARILSRTFFDPKIRLKPGYNFWVETPVAPMARHQISWIIKHSDLHTLFITMEPNHSFKYFSRIIGKINKRSKAQFLVQEEKMNTYPGQPLEMYQHAAVMTLDRA